MCIQAIHTNIQHIAQVSLRYPFEGGGIAPPLVLSEGENAQKRGRGYRTQLAMLRHQKPIARNRGGVSLR